MGWARAKKGELAVRIEKVRSCLLSLLRMPGKAMETGEAPTPGGGLQCLPGGASEQRLEGRGRADQEAGVCFRLRHLWGEKLFVWDGDDYDSQCHWSVRVAGTAPGLGRIQSEHFIPSHKVLQWLPEDFGIKPRRFLGASNEILCTC